MLVRLCVSGRSLCVQPPESYCKPLLSESHVLSTEQESSPPVWRRRPLENIVWTGFDEDFVAYHRPSGKTHFLNAASHILICDVLSEPMDLISIANAFVPDEPDQLDDNYLVQLQAMIARLEHLGLVERV